MARININELKRQIAQDEKNLETVKNQIESIPLEKRLENGELYNQMIATTKADMFRRRMLLQEEQRREKLENAWFIIKHVAGALIGALGFWALTSLMIIFS